MTPLNTIIEEEKPDFHMIALAKSECAKNAGELTVVRLGYVTQLLEDVYTTALQRAYEAGEREADAKWEREVEVIKKEYPVNAQPTTKEHEMRINWANPVVHESLDTLLSKIRS